jgi:hypothetical protein
LEDGYDIRTVQEPLGHKDVRTTMVSTNVSNRGGRGVRNPLDVLQKAVSNDGRFRPTGRSPKIGEQVLGTLEVVVNGMVPGPAAGGNFVLGWPGSVLSRST